MISHGLEETLRYHGLSPSSEITAADWIRPRLRPFASAVGAVVPDGFAAYVQIPHPAPGDGSNLPLGDLPAELLRILCSALATHTESTGACYFCLWDGYGWLQGSPAISSLTARRSDGLPAVSPQPIPPAASLNQLHGPRVRLPNRNYLLFTGPLEAAIELGWTIGEIFVPQSPNLFWPQDHAWCVASEIDLTYTLVVGSESLAEVLVADQRLQAARVNPGDALT